jgi:hypothetical protein
MNSIEDVERRIQGLSARTSPQLDDRILEEAGRVLEGGCAPRRTRSWRGWVLAAAALVGLAVLGVLPRGGPAGNVVWADVLQRVQEARDYICRTRSWYNLRDSDDQESVRYVSSEHGIRQDIYVRGELEVREYLLPGQGALMVDPDGRDWARIQLREREIEELMAGADAARMVGDIRSEPFRDLGRKRIDGVWCEGIEVEDPSFILTFFEGGYLRLWAAVETGWPVRLEGSWRAGGRRVVSFEFTDFEWNADLPTSLFEPHVPYDRAPMFDLDIPVVDEAHALTGLRSYADILRGQYPERPVIMEALTQYFDFRARHPVGQRQRWNEMEELNDLRSTFEFIHGLQAEDREVVYRGGEVTPLDFDRVLLRWRLSDGTYRVVYGDLRTETVDADRLAVIERER